MAEQSDKVELAWEASEYVHHEKSPVWFLLFGLGATAVVAGTYLILQEVFSIIVVTLMAITVIVYANRQPRSLRYELTDVGIKIEDRAYGYNSFKSFSIMQYGAVESVYLEPLERFMPPISIYYAPEDSQQVIEVLGRYLPHRDRQPDLIDRVVHRIRL